MTSSDPPPIAEIPTACDPVTAPVPAPAAAASSPPPKGSAPSSYLSKLPVPVPASLLSAASSVPGELDAVLSHVDRCLSTPAGTDTVLQFVGYGAKTTAALLTLGADAAIRRRAISAAIANAVVGVAAVPGKGAVLIASTAATTVAPTGAVLALDVAARLRALSGAVSEARTFSRLWGLLGLYFWLRRLVATRSRSALAWAQLTSCVAFQALENWAFLADKNVLAAPRSGTTKHLWRWASRFWAVYVALELGKLAGEGLALRRAARSKKTRAAVDEKKADDAATTGEESAVLVPPTTATTEKDALAAAEAEALADRAAAQAAAGSKWAKSVARNAAWAPLTLHGSFEGGVGVTELGSGLLGGVPGVIQMADLWRDTA